MLNDTLNMVYENRSDIFYNLSKYPDGQQQVELFQKCNPVVTIKARLNNFNDLEKIICATASLRNAGARRITLFVPYFLGSRSDRKFNPFSNNYLKDIIGPIINMQKFDAVITADPHSHVLEACIDKLSVVDTSYLLRYALHDTGDASTYLVAPDAGAVSRIKKAVEDLVIPNEIIFCSKHRLPSGDITIKPNSEPSRGSKVFVVDDICDGGKTFIEVAKAFNKPKSQMFLVVTHGIFSKGFEVLQEYYQTIYCTNSYSDIFTQSSVKQINIF